MRSLVRAVGLAPACGPPGRAGTSRFAARRPVRPLKIERHKIQNLIPHENHSLKDCMGRRKTIKPAEFVAGSRKNASDYETEEILRDPIIMMMLDAAERQYKEGKAIPLAKFIHSDIYLA